MNPGISEEAGKTARGIVDALKVQPMTLAVMIAFIVLLVYHFYSQNRQFATRDHNLEQLFEGQKTIFAQWSDIVKGQAQLNEKLLHCMTPEDLAKVIQSTRPPEIEGGKR